VFNKKLGLLLAFLFFSFVFFSPRQARGEHELSWEFEIDPQGWSAQSQIIDLGARDGMLTGKSIGSLPFFVSPFPLNIDSDQYKIVILEMSEQAEYEDTFILWRGNYYNQFNMAQGMRISLGSKNRFHKYYLNLGLHPQWVGFIQQLLIIPGMKPGEFKVKFIKLEKPNPINVLMAAWQEFTAYEPIKGSTINTIKSQTIMGKAVNYYVIILLLFCFAAVFAWRSYAAQFDLLKVKNAAKFALHSTTILMLVVWVLLEARMSMDYFKSFSLDFQTYWGRSLDEKRAIISLGDFYDFMLFCNKSLPEGVEVNILASNVYFSDRAGMYLYPHIIRNNVVADYLIVYDTDPDHEKYKGFELFAKFSEGEYILKRGVK
jgi:hypothetical protein